MMKELKEIRFNESNIQLQDHLVKGSILPEKASELNRCITIQGNTIIEGPVYAHKLEIQNGDLEIQGAVFTQLELYINSDAQGAICFKKSVGSANAVVSRAGVFATQQIDLKNCVVGTFNTPSVRVEGVNFLLLPSAFSIEKMVVTADAQLYNLCLADLGALYKRLPQAENSGKIVMNLETDEVKSVLANEELQKTLRSYTVIGKVLAADLIDTDKFQTHFLLTAASLNTQLLKTYDLGIDKDGNPATLSLEKISAFFFDILNGKISIQTIDGSFDLSAITGKI